jgi:hypothetical protein
MDNWLANIVDDVDSLHVEIDNLNNLLVGFYFIRSIDVLLKSSWIMQDYEEEMKKLDLSQKCIFDKSNELTTICSDA